MIGYDVFGAFDETNDDDSDSNDTCTSNTQPLHNVTIYNQPIRIRRKVSVRQKKEVAYRQRYKCVYCGMLLQPSYQIDHYIPLWQGGSNFTSNLVATCGNCHNEKTAIENDRCSPYFRHVFFF